MPRAFFRPRHRLKGRLRVLHLLAWTLALLFAVEVLAQAREYWLFGRSILNSIIGQPDFVVDPATGLLLLRPNAVIRGQRQEILSNSLGLRSEELPADKVPGQYRVAVIGASSVMGAYSKTNADTLPAMLMVRLRAALVGVDVRVINAGIVGYGLDDQRRMLGYLADHLSPDLVFVYPGVNDFAGYCRAARTPGLVNAYPLPQVELPRWLMSVDLLLKNTIALRPVAQVSNRVVDASTLDITAYRQRIEMLVLAARDRNIRLVLSTNARNYRPDQAPEVQQERAQTARFYNPCFDVNGLNTLYQRHNDVIDEVGAKYGVPVLHVGDRVPGEPTYFRDSVHFSTEGKALVAQIFAEYAVDKYGPVWGRRQ